MLSPANFSEYLERDALQHPSTVVFPDVADIRTLKAAVYLSEKKLCMPVLVGNPGQIEQIALQHSININNLTIINPETQPERDIYAQTLAKLRAHKGLTIEESQQLVLKPLFFAGMMLRNNTADCCIAGSLSSTADVLRAGLQTVGLQAGNSTLSSFFLMRFPDELWVYADCAVVPEPTAEQLTDITIASAANFTALTGAPPRIALLSYSTNGSGGNNATVEKIRIVRERVQLSHPDWNIDGELQFDAAWSAEIRLRKSPDSPLQGRANVYIFPDLNAGNIAYKITERLGGAQAIGPIVQGLNKPYMDLSRGCTAEDIVQTTLISICMQKKTSEISG